MDVTGHERVTEQWDVFVEDPAIAHSRAGEPQFPILLIGVLVDVAEGVEQLLGLPPGDEIVATIREGLHAVQQELRIRRQVDDPARLVLEHEVDGHPGDSAGTARRNPNIDEAATGEDVLHARGRSEGRMGLVLVEHNL